MSATAHSLQLVLLTGEESRTIDLPGAGTVSIGRGSDCIVRILDPSVSRRHAVVHVGETIFIEDLGSANGTTIRDRADAGGMSETVNIRHLAGKKAELSVGDTVMLGTACIVLRRAPAAESSIAHDSCEDMVVQDPAMRELYAQAARAAATPISILLLGETGVGKEVLARMIHHRSGRAGGPFQAINCAALPESLLESELFGHERGAFTGAAQTRPGLFEVAAGGTVLLDEVGEMSPSTQVKLLRVIEEREIVRLGGNRPTPIDVRFIAATNRDLDVQCQTGLFRRDLYFRLNGLSLHIPPLRERPTEIEPLARRFLAVACGSIERHPALDIEPECLARLRSHAWPGNVRELRNVMERAAVLSSGPVIRVGDLPVSLLQGRPVDPSSRIASALPTEIRALERARIVAALERTGGVQTEAARALGISRRTLISRIEAFGLPRPRKRAGKPAADV